MIFSEVMNVKKHTNTLNRLHCAVSFLKKYKQQLCLQENERIANDFAKQFEQFIIIYFQNFKMLKYNITRPLKHVWRFEL